MRSDILCLVLTAEPWLANSPPVLDMLCVIQVYAMAQRTWIPRQQQAGGPSRSTAGLGLVHQSRTCPGAGPACRHLRCS